MSLYGTKSKTTKILAEFRHARFFQDDHVAHLYQDLEVVKPEYDKEKKLLNPDQVGKPKNLKQYEGTPRDAYVAFKRTRIGADDKPIRELLYHQDQVDWPVYYAAVRELAGKNEPQDEADETYLKPAERTEPIYARAEYFTRRIFGSYFVLPDDFQNKDLYGDDAVPDGLDPEATHEFAGKIPPISHEWFENWDVSVLVEYLNHMDAVHGGRSPAQESNFPAGTVPADDEPVVPVGRGSTRKKPA